MNRFRRAALAITAGFASSTSLLAQTDPLPSWNDGAAKRAIVTFVRETTTPGGPKFVAPEDRVAVFDQDGTLWVEQPVYAQMVFALDRVPSIIAKTPNLATVEPFKTILSGDHTAIAKLPAAELEKVLGAAISGITVEQFTYEVKQWLASARHPRWKRPYDQLAYQPMLEVMRWLRANGYKTFIVTGGGQDFVRVYAEHTYGVPPENVVGSAGETRFGYDTHGRPVLTKEPSVLLIDDRAGKPEGIHLMIGRAPIIAFGNSTGDQQMLEYTGAGTGAHLMMLVLHDDARREFAYGPAKGLPDSKIGRFTKALYDEAKAKGWFVISMKNDWKRIFQFEP